MGRNAVDYQSLELLSLTDEERPASTDAWSMVDYPASSTGSNGSRPRHMEPLRLPSAARRIEGLPSLPTETAALS
jgi:hypothetical protein